MDIIYTWVLENVINTQEAIIAIRLLVAAVVGFMIGIERKHVKGDPAILRMHIFICVGACLVSAVGCWIAEASGGDPSRIAAQVVGSIGFLGMGVIFRNGVIFSHYIIQTLHISEQAVFNTFHITYQFTQYRTHLVYCLCHNSGFIFFLH